MREMQMKTTMCYNFTPIRYTKREELEKSYISGRNVEKHSYYGKQFNSSSKC